jgi:hypothetical protein
MALIKFETEKNIYDVLNRSYQEICDFSVFARQMKRTSIDDLQGFLTTAEFQLTGVAFMTRQEKKAFEGVVFGNMRRSFEELYEKLYIPFEILNEAASIYAKMTVSRMSASKSGKNKTLKLGNESNEKTVEESRQFSIGNVFSKILPEKFYWMIGAMILNILLIFLAVKYAPKLFGNLQKYAAF